MYKLVDIMRQKDDLAFAQLQIQIIIQLKHSYRLDTQRTFILNYKTYQRIQFPLTPASGKSVCKAEGATVDRVVVDLSQEKRIIKKIPHIHYVAISRVKKLEELYILNMNEGAMALDDDVLWL